MGDGAPKGSSGHSELSYTEPAADEVGGMGGGSTTSEVRGGGARGSLTAGFDRMGAFAKACPDAEGRVRGEAAFGLNLTIEVSTVGRSGFKSGVEGDFVAHVGDDARLVDYDYKAFFTFEYPKGGGTDTYRMTVWRTGADPRNGWDFSSDAAIRRSLRGMTYAFYGPKGRIWPGGDDDGLAGLGIFAVDNMEREIREVLQGAEKGWYEKERCVAVDATSDRQQVERGGSASVDATARMRDGSPLGVPVRFEVDPAPATASPMTGTDNPFHTVVTDSGAQWGLSGLDPSACVLATSRRGRGHGCAGWKVPEGTAPLFDLTLRIEEHLGTGDGPLMSAYTYTGRLDHADGPAASSGKGTYDGTFWNGGFTGNCRPVADGVHGTATLGGSVNQARTELGVSAFPGPDEPNAFLLGYFDGGFGASNGEHTVQYAPSDSGMGDCGVHVKVVTLTVADLHYGS